MLAAAHQRFTMYTLLVEHTVPAAGCMLGANQGIQRLVLLDSACCISAYIHVARLQVGGTAVQ